MGEIPWDPYDTRNLVRPRPRKLEKKTIAKLERDRRKRLDKEARKQGNTYVQARLGYYEFMLLKAWVDLRAQRGDPVSLGRALMEAFRAFAKANQVEDVCVRAGTFKRWW